MKIFNLILGVFLLSLGGSADAAQRKGIIFSEDFNDMQKILTLEFKNSGNPNATIVREKFLGMSPAVKLWLDPWHDEVTYRSELVPFTVFSQDLQRMKHAILGKEYWYGIRIFLPKDRRYDKEREIIMQWHDQPDWNLKEDWRSPCVELDIGPSQRRGIATNYLVFVRSDAKQLTPSKENKNRYQAEDQFDLGPIEGDLGKWTQWVMHVRWSYEDDGFLKLWKNGEVVLDLPHYPNAYNDRYGPYCKFGIYKWVWKNIEKARGVAPRVIYYDDFYIGNAQASYTDVAADEGQKR